MSQALDPAGSASILAVQCSCSWVESRDRACVSEPPTRWKRTDLYPCRHLDSPNRAGRLPTAQCVHVNVLSACRYREAVINLPRFSDLGLSPPILGALAAEGYAAPTPINSRPSRRFSAGATCAASHKPAPARPPPSHYQSSGASPPFHNEPHRTPAASSC